MRVIHKPAQFTRCGGASGPAEDHRQRTTAILLALALLAGGCTASPALTPRIITPTPLPATPTTTPPIPAMPSPTFPPAPAASPTPEPAPDPSQLQAVAETGMAALQEAAGEANILCMRYEDTDTDGQPEWVALTQRQGSTTNRLDAFVLDDGIVYELPSAQPKPGAPDIGLGEFATCEIEIRDVNVDGMPEIAIFGHAKGNETLLHLFAWEDDGYRRLGFFSGNAGVSFMDLDGDLEEEIWEGYRMQSAPSIAWYVVYTWENNTYGWTSDAYGWYFDDRPQSYPTHLPDTTVIAFYLALNERDLPGAYELLLPQSRPSYEEWAIGYATTLQVSAGDVHTIPAATGESRSRVSAMVRAWDNERGVLVGRLWNVEWDMTLTEDGWRLLTSTAELLDEWPVSYWP
ncbi:MAG: hypothetical protein MUQ30_07120 [Anaerolineae bacterium]|nr:hypothetical protein [Anaerolineae bacterium]